MRLPQILFPSTLVLHRQGEATAFGERQDRGEQVRGRVRFGRRRVSVGDRTVIAIGTVALEVECVPGDRLNFNDQDYTAVGVEPKLAAVGGEVAWWEVSIR